MSGAQVPVPSDQGHQQTDTKTDDQKGDHDRTEFFAFGERPNLVGQALERRLIAIMLHLELQYLALRRLPEGAKLNFGFPSFVFHPR